MKTNKSFHTKAFLTNFELACEFGAFICLVDFMWLLHDIGANGFNAFYGFIGAGLVIGFSGTLYVLYKHHKAYTHRLARKYKHHQKLNNYLEDWGI